MGTEYRPHWTDIHWNEPVLTRRAGELAEGLRRGGGRGGEGGGVLPFLSPYRVAVGAVCQMTPFRYAQRLIHRLGLVERK
jgi:hypothetical protein